MNNTYILGASWSFSVVQKSPMFEYNPWFALPLNTFRKGLHQNAISEVVGKADCTGAVCLDSTLGERRFDLYGVCELCVVDEGRGMGIIGTVVRTLFSEMVSNTGGTSEMSVIRGG